MLEVTEAYLQDSFEESFTVTFVTNIPNSLPLTTKHLTKSEVSELIFSAVLQPVVEFE